MHETAGSLPPQAARGGQPFRLRPTRRAILETSGVATALAMAGSIGLPLTAASAQAAPAAPVRPTPPRTPVNFMINGRAYTLELDPRTSLLDTLREHLHLNGSKKGCDHGQCGACTVLVNGRRINSCLTLAVMHDGDEITTIEGLASDGELHPLQAAFIERDGFQCGYCTPGQICSAVGMLGEAAAGWPSHATADVSAPRIALTDAEIRERMSGNLCRCAAYMNITAAIRDTARQQHPTLLGSL